MQNSTHVRTIDLSSLAGKTVSSEAFVDEADTAAGSWAIIYEQVSLVSTDGTVFPIYTGQTSSPVSSISSASGVSGAGSSIDNNRGHAIYPALTTTYYSADHLGSARMITSGNGYPVWSGVFAPFGQEVSPQITMNHYKFTDDEHDSESNLEHTWFRQLSTTEGRWLSPDPYSGSMDLTNPQSLNRYAYVLNNPTNGTDPSGMYGLFDDFAAFEWFGDWGGHGDFGGNVAGSNGVYCLGSRCTWNQAMFGDGATISTGPSGFGFSGSFNFGPPIGGTWNEGLPSGLEINNPGLLGAIFPDLNQQCEFGPCESGGPFSFTQGAANNGTTLEQWQQYQSQKHCYSGSSLTDKTVRFFSLLRLPETWKEWVVGGGTKLLFFGSAEAGAKSAGGTGSMGAAALRTGGKILGTAGSAATGLATMADFDCQIGPVEPYTQK